MTKKSRRAFLKSLTGLIFLPFLYLGKSGADIARRLSKKRLLLIPIRDIHPGRNDFDSVIIIRKEEQLTVLSRKCTHLGCRIRNSGKGYTCPCHGSEFSPFGNVLRGPATRPLQKLPHRQNGDTIQIRI